MAILINERGIGRVLVKNINGVNVHIQKSFDFKHGRGWFVWAYPDVVWKDRGFGFSKNRFTAVRNALKDIKLANNYNLYLD